MSHATLTHPTRPDLTFRQAQRDDDSRDADSIIATQLGSGRPPIVHIRTRKRERSIQGRVTAPRRARNDPDTSDWRQALANYVDRLESHVDEFQGNGYTLTDSIRGETLDCLYHSIEWTLKQGSPFEFEYNLKLAIGDGTFEERPIERRNPTVDSAMNVAARVGGEDLPGLRRMTVTRSYGMQVNPVYDVSTAENNDVVPQEGTRMDVTFEGTHSGTDAERAAADDALQSLIGGGQVTFETKFPGYDLDGFVLGYDSNLESRFGAESHQYVLRFIEGVSK